MGRTKAFVNGKGRRLDRKGTNIRIKIYYAQVKTPYDECDQHV